MAAFGAEHYWSALPAVQRRLNRLASGSEQRDWIDHCLATYFAGRLPLPRCLSLGCGTGWLERSLACRDAFQQCEAIDIAPGAIHQAQEEAHAAGFDHITYHVADLNTISLPRQSYDAIWMHHAYHHVANLEHLAEQISRALKPDGFFLLNDYVGPNHFQFPAVQRAALQRALELLPARYRRLSRYAQHTESERAHRLVRDPAWALARLGDKIRDRDLFPALLRKAQALLRLWGRRPDQEPIKRRVTLPTVHDVVSTDPSEAIRSNDILEVVQRYFRIVEFRPLGGNILHFLLDGIAHNFPDNDPQAQAWLQMLFALEDAFLAERICSTDFALIIAARPENAADGS